MRYYISFFNRNFFYKFILFLGLLFYNSSALAITPVTSTNNHQKKIMANKKNQQIKEPIYLLDWQKNKINTTAGVFIINDSIKIIDENNTKETFLSQPQNKYNHRKLHRITLKHDGRKLVQITIK